MELDVTCWMLQQDGAKLWLDKVILEDGAQNGPDHLGYSSFQAGDPIGPFTSNGKPCFFMAQVVLELEEAGVDTPGLPLSSAKHISWDDLICIKNQIPWLVMATWLNGMHFLDQLGEAGTSGKEACQVDQWMAKEHLHLLAIFLTRDAVWINGPRWPP